jgi:hypothetical protein
MLSFLPKNKDRYKHVIALLNGNQQVEKRISKFHPALPIFWCGEPQRNAIEFSAKIAYLLNFYRIGQI